MEEKNVYEAPKYTVTIYKDGKGKVIRDVIQDGYVMIDGQVLPIRWLVTTEGIRHEIPIEATRFEYSVERFISMQQAAEKLAAEEGSA